MRVFKPLLVMFCLGVFVLSVPLIVRADDWNKETLMTFKQPVEVPGMVLKAGTYQFRLMDSPTMRNVVQILNADGTHLYKNVLAIPAYRLEPADKTVVTFEERAQGAPEAIATWFYPGDNSGEEFVYPKVSTAALTANAATPSVTASVVESKPAPVVQQTNAPGEQVKPAAVPVTTNPPVQVAQAATQPNPAVSSTATAPPQKQTIKKLPKTASPLPILIVLGLLSLGASAGIHAYSKQSI
jgi:hypothetical protein